MTVEIDKGSAGPDRVICYCFGVTEKQMLSHFADPTKTYETLVEATNIGTRCTACLLDVDMVMEKTFRTRSQQNSQKLVKRNAGLGAPADETNIGYILNRDGISTRLRIANRHLLFAGNSPLCDFRYQLRLFSADGRHCATLKGAIPADSDLEIDFSTVENVPDLGWFWVSIVADSQGILGSVRPQMLLTTKSWAAPYHLQPLTMIDHDKFGMFYSANGRTSASLPVINPNNQATAMTIGVFAPSSRWRAKRDIEISANGMVIVDVDELFPEIPLDQTLVISLDSRLPTQKYIITRQQDGSFGLDHFPNKK